MYYFDFFSESPKIYIFQKEANKTKFGGFLYIIFNIIMFFISLAYILDYYWNDKYMVEFYRSLIPLNNQEERHKFDKDFEISWKFRILDHEGNQYPEDEFAIFFYQVPVQQKKFYKCKLSNFFLKIYYMCQNEICTPQIKSKFYYLEIEYTGFELYHQNDTFPPLQTNGNKTFIYWQRFNFDFPSSIYLNWEYTNYEEEKGVPKLLNPFQTKKDQKDEYSSGFISSSTFVLQEKNYYESSSDEDFKLLTFVDLGNSFMISQYKRKKIGFLDVVSKIGALFSTIRVFFLIFFKYYSNNFNNYKIIEKILISNYNNRKIELSEEIKESKTGQSKEDNKKIDNTITGPLIPNISEDKQLIFNDENKNGENDNEDGDEDKPLKELPKYSFINFFFNRIYCRNCLKIKKQEIISIYNEILFKYFSVDTILYNQIMLENLFKDYQWNNSSLNNIQNNSLIIKLKKMINT